MPGCADTVDVGETAYAAVLADDLDGDGRTELVLATMNGVLFCFQAAASRFQPLHAWPAQARARPGRPPPPPTAPGARARAFARNPACPACAGARTWPTPALHPPALGVCGCARTCMPGPCGRLPCRPLPPCPCWALEGTPPARAG